MTVRLRAHHLLCLLTYAGKGYSKAFTTSFDLIAQRVCGGEDIIIIDGPDDVCAPLLGEPEPHCFRQSVIRRDRLAARDLGALLSRPIKAGEQIKLCARDLSAMRQAFADGSVRSACEGCQWTELCSEIAAAGFKGTRLKPTRAKQR